MRIHLIRHGQIPSNVTGALDTTVPGPSLTEIGQAQATALVDRLKDVPLDGVWASTIVRTQETAAPLAAARSMDVKILDGLREISAGDMEMSIAPEHRDEYHAVITQWILGDLDVPLAGGETGHEVLQRFEDALAQIAASGTGTACFVYTRTHLLGSKIFGSGHFRSKQNSAVACFESLKASHRAMRFTAICSSFTEYPA